MGKPQNKFRSIIDNIKRNYKLIIILFLLAFVVLIVYGNDFQILVNEAIQNEAYSHFLLFPFFAGFLFYLKKDLVKASLIMDKLKNKSKIDYASQIFGIILILTAFLVYWYGSSTFYPLEYHMLSLPVFIMGISLVILNFRASLKLIFPILFILFLVPLPTIFLTVIGGSLANFNTMTSYTILKAAGLPITLSGDYGAPTVMMTTAAGQAASFTVDLPCSGIYSIVAFAMFAAFLAFISETTKFKKVMVFILGFAVFILLNLLRILAIFSFGYLFGEEVGMAIHQFAGIILIFAGMLLVLILAGKILKIQIVTKSRAIPSCPSCQSTTFNSGFCRNCGRFLSRSTKFFYNKTLFAKILILIICCELVALSINAQTFTTVQGSNALNILTDYENANSTLPQISGYSLSYLYRDINYEKIAKQDLSVLYGYFQTNASGPVIYVDIGVANSISLLHNWETCLVTYQTEIGQNALVTVHDSRETRILQNPSLIAEYLVFDSPNGYTQITLYWYEKLSLKTGLTVQQKYVRLSVLMLVDNASDYRALEEELFAVGQVIAESWEPLQTQSLISLGIPTQQTLLSALIVFFIGALAIRYVSEKNKTSINRRLFSKFPSKKEQTVLAAISELTKKTKYVKTDDITREIQKHVGKPVNSRTVYRLLNELEEYGFIIKTIISIGNAPVVVWKIP